MAAVLLQNALRSLQRLLVLLRLIGALWTHITRRRTRTDTGADTDTQAEAETDRERRRRQRQSLVRAALPPSASVPHALWWCAMGVSGYEYLLEQRLLLAGQRLGGVRRLRCGDRRCRGGGGGGGGSRRGRGRLRLRLGRHRRGGSKGGGEGRKGRGGRETRG